MPRPDGTADELRLPRPARIAQQSVRPPALGLPRRHFRLVDSTNRVAGELAAAGAPHGTLVTATEQSAGRGRQGRTWVAPAGNSLLMSLVIREPSRILSLVAGVAVAEVVDTVAACPSRAMLKWPNDVLLDARKLAGILVEGRPQDRWAVLGIGINVAVGSQDLPPEVRDRAATLGLEPADVERVLYALLSGLERQLDATDAEVPAALAERDYLRGREITWDTNAGPVTGIATGIDVGGGLRALLPDGSTTVLDAGEVHIGS